MSEEHEPEQEEKPDRTIVTEQGSGENVKDDDCSELTDNNVDNNVDSSDESCPRSFPRKLMEILSNEQHHDIISWLPHGYGFIIHKKKVFASEILPHHFKASKFTSFTRKLNRWGFNRAARGPETGAYYHKLFVREKPELVFQMTSNSGNKFSPSPQIHNTGLLPLPVMMGNPGPPTPGGGTMPFFMQPLPQMAMLSPQQQQSLWQQQMQMFQFQQMQMMRYQQQHGGPPPPGMPPMMMPMSPHAMIHPRLPGNENQQGELGPNQDGASTSNIQTEIGDNVIPAHDPLVAIGGDDGVASDLVQEEDNNPLDDLGSGGIIEC